MVTCEITVSGPHSFEVCVITHWDAALSAIEVYDTPDSAMIRHEQVVSALRNAGWVRLSDANTNLTAT